MPVSDNLLLLLSVLIGDATDVWNGDWTTFVSVIHHVHVACEIGERHDHPDDGRNDAEKTKEGDHTKCKCEQKQERYVFQPKPTLSTKL